MDPWLIALFALFGIRMLGGSTAAREENGGGGNGGGFNFSQWLPDYAGSDMRVLIQSPADPAPLVSGLFGAPEEIPSVTNGLLVMSTDEDIGIAPVLVQAPTPTNIPNVPEGALPDLVVVQDSNTPVIEQTPVFALGPRTDAIFTLAGSKGAEYLTGPVENLRGTDQIRVANIEGGEDPFVTTPDVLAAYLKLFD